MTNPYRRVLFGALLGCIFWITGCSSSAVPINPGIQSQSPLGNTEASQSAPIAPQAAGQAAASLTTQSVSARPEVINCPQVSGKPSIACCSYVQSKLSGPSLRAIRLQRQLQSRLERLHPIALALIHRVDIQHPLVVGQ